MTEAAADQELTLEDELEFEEILDEDDEPEVDDGEDEPDDEPEGRAPAKPAAQPERSPELEEALLHVENANRFAGAMRRENKTLQDRIERGEQRMARLLEALAEKQGINVADLDTPPEEKIPDPDEDIAGHIVAKVRREIAGLTGKLEDQKAQEKAQAEIDTRIGQVKSFHEADVSRFEQEHPDYDAAETFVLEQTYATQEAAIRAAHPRAPKAWVEQRAQAALMDIVARHQLQFAADGASLAEYVYQRAIEGGYQPGNGNGRPTPAKKPRAGGAADLKDRRQRAGTSLAAVSGSPATGGKRIEQLADMEDDEFAELMDGIEGKSGSDGWKRVTAKLMAAS